MPVYDSGSTDRFPVYIVSKYVEGSDLATRLGKSRLSHTAAAELVATVADALQHAHGHALKHRDIKPGNILLDSSGKPFVVDFGLALTDRELGKGPNYAGTPSYMSPEQARGEGHRVDGRTDIFSLSVVFYELLTGRKPFVGDTTVDTFMQITTCDPDPPRQYDPDIPKELERICLKGLSKRADDRYTTARDLADELRLFLTETAEAGAAMPAEPAGETPAQVEAPAVRPRPIVNRSRSFPRGSDPLTNMMPTFPGTPPRATGP